MTFKKFISNFLDKINTADHIFIYPHVSADGDALGSCLALKLFLDSKGKNSFIVINENIPKIYQFLFEGNEYINSEATKNIVCDLHIAIDTGDQKRLGKRSESFVGNTVNIDHHRTNNGYASLNYIDSQASSSGEIIYNIIKAMDGAFTKAIADCIFVAMSTDTGGFRFSNTNEKCFLIASELLSYGINISDIAKRVFETNSIEKTKLMGETINKLQFFNDNKVALATFSKNEYLKLNVKEEMFDGIIQIPRNIEGVIVAAIIKETLSGDIKVNLRANTDEIDVSIIAYENHGGGHKRAAGYTSELNSIDETRKKLIKDIEKQLI